MLFSRSMKQILKYSARVLPGQRLAKAERIRLVADTTIEGVGVCTVHGRGQFDEFAAGGGTHLFGVLHQQLAYPTAACPPVDHQGRHAHDRACVLQHPTQMQCEKSEDLTLRDREKYRVRRG